MIISRIMPESILSLPLSLIVVGVFILGSEHQVVHAKPTSTSAMTARDLASKDEVFTAAIKTKNFSSIRDSTVEYVDALLAANERERCERILDKAALILRANSPDNAAMSDIYQRQMVNYYEMGKISLADLCRDKAIAINLKVRPVSDPTAWTYFLAADQQFRSKHYEKALAFFAEARDAFEQLKPNPLATRDCYFVDVKVAQIEMARGNFRQATSLFERSLPNLENYPEPFFNPAMYVEAASSYQKTGDEKHRQDSLKRAYETAKRRQTKIL